MEKKMVAALILVLVAVSIVGAALGQIVLKKGVDSLEGYSVVDLLKPWNLPKIFVQSPLIFVGLVIYAIGFIIWIAALSKLDVSFMYPMLSLAYVLVAVLSFIFLKETISVYRWIGIALVTVGTFFLLKSL